MDIILPPEMRKRVYSMEDIREAVKDLLADGGPVEVWRIADATGLTEEKIMADLIWGSTGGKYVEFRFPSIPCAAVTALT